MATAVAVYTNTPLRKVFDITLGSTGGTAGGDTGSIAVPHGINFTDFAGTVVGSASSVPINAAAPLYTEVFCAPYGASAAAARGAVPWIDSIDGTNVNIGFMPSNPAGVFNAGVVRMQVQRVHSIQG